METPYSYISSKNYIKSLTFDYIESDWLEWQANYYASTLLMPKDTFKAALILSQQKIGISRVGKIFVDNQPANQADFYKLITMLSEFFKVSRTAVDIILKKMGLVEDR
jgi:Zn-dependent peptidase ImmA (M78 family)